MQGPESAVDPIPGGDEPEEFTYKDIIPKLGPARERDTFPSLLPFQGGRPGFEYLQCPLTSQKAARKEGWSQVKDTEIFTIEGPLGVLDLVLLARGELIGADTSNNKRVMYLDPDIEEITGLDSVTGLPKKAPAKGPPSAEKSK